MNSEKVNPIVHEKVRINVPTIYSLPYRLRIQYHDCGDYKAGPGRQRPPVMCLNCNKVVPWFFHTCTVCHTVFIKDFESRKWCTYYPTCWEHTQELPWDYCSEHRSYLKYTDLQEYPPKGLNPQTFTDDELADVFDFD